MNLADALKKLYTKLGGTDALPKGTDTCTLVDKIADKVSGGGGASGGKAIYLTVSVSGETAHLGKTYGEIAGLVEEGNNIWVLFPTGALVEGFTFIVPLAGYGHGSNNYYASVLNPINNIAISFSSSSQTQELVWKNSDDDGETS